jgi:lipoprotein-anchoring transpeptidase ErfK/SrfK
VARVQRFGTYGRGAIGAAGVALLVVAGLTACGGKHDAAKAQAGGSRIAAADTSSAPAPSTSTSASVPAASLSFDPADGAANVSPATPITVTAAGGTIGNVTLTSSTGAAVTGTLSADNSVWTASAPLGYDHTYTLTAAATNADGKATTQTAAFTTLKPSNQTAAVIDYQGGYNLTDGATYGVGIVPVVHFDEKITDKAAATKALVVTATPAITGSWYWTDDQNAHYRPNVPDGQYWPAGTKVTVAADIYGVQVGSGLYGQADISKSFTIGQKQVSIADDTTHQVTVYFNDVLQRSMPTSMGKGGYYKGTQGTISYFTPSGTYTVLEKDASVVMDSSTYGLPVTAPGGYKETIYNATKISVDGIYLHELDTTVWAQGSRDLSHGCLNLNKTNAIWYQQTSQIGDPVVVEHTGGAPLALWQNGDWTMPYAQWAAGGVQ